MACELVSLVAADETCIRSAAVGTELNKDCSIDEFRLVCRDMGFRVNCGSGVKEFRKGRCVWVEGVALFVEDVVVARFGLLRRFSGGIVVVEMKRLWLFLESGSRSRFLFILLCISKVLFEGSITGRFSSFIFLFLFFSFFGLFSLFSCFLFINELGFAVSVFLFFGAGKFGAVFRSVILGVLWERVALLLKLCVLRLVVRFSLKAKSLGGVLFGFSSLVFVRASGKFFLGWAVSLALVESGSFRSGRKANREFWFRVELVCSGLSAVLVRSRSEIGEKVDFYLLLLTGSSAGVGFFFVRSLFDRER